MLNLGSRVLKFQKAWEHKEALQESRDEAQDELMTMEMERIGRELDIRLKAEDMDKAADRWHADIETARRDLENRIVRESSRIQNETTQQANKILSQLQTVTKSADQQIKLISLRLDVLRGDMNEQVITLRQETKAVVNEVCLPILNYATMHLLTFFVLA